MKPPRFPFSFIIIFTLTQTLNAQSSVIKESIPVADYYVATPANGGNDYNPGTFEKPFASWQRAFNLMKPGQLTYVRGGQYYGNEITFTGSGTVGNLKKLWAYPGETPILSCPSNVISGWGILLQNCNYIHLKGLEICFFKQEATKQSLCVGLWSYTGSTTSNSIFENLNCHHNGVGAYFKGENNYVLNCDFHDNYDNFSGYGNGDGVDIGSINSTDGGGTSTVEGCRAWNNSDDGFDTWHNNDLVVFKNCWSWNNGVCEDGSTPGGDGMGFKLGATTKNYPATVKRIVTNCISYHNSRHAFDINVDMSSEGMGVTQIYNCTAYKNGWGDAAWPTAYNLNYNTINSHVVRNCISLNNQHDYNFNAYVVDDHNTWSPEFIVSESDFISVDSAGLSGSRKVDGSLPDIDFLRLSPTSKLVDAGVDVGLTFNGTAPDLGAFETGLGTSSSFLEIQDGDFRVYPNPVNNILNISTKGDVKEMSLKLYDMRGIELYKSVKTGNVKLYMSKYQSGIYFLQVICDGKTTTRKIMKY